jgi:hypothetical protein
MAAGNDPLLSLIPSFFKSSLTMQCKGFNICHIGTGNLNLLLRSCQSDYSCGVNGSELGQCSAMSIGVMCKLQHLDNKG